MGDRLLVLTGDWGFGVYLLGSCDVRVRARCVTFRSLR